MVSGAYLIQKIAVTAPNSIGKTKSHRQFAKLLMTIPAIEEKKLQLKNNPTTRPRTFFLKSLPISIKPKGIALAAENPIRIRATNIHEIECVIAQKKFNNA